MGKQTTIDRPKHSRVTVQRQSARHGKDASQAVATRPPTRQRLPGRIRVGTASWTDPGFIAEWYPPRMPARERLSWYARHFHLVEVNSTFYGVPPRSRVTEWCEQTPADFVFDVKLHRLLSRHSTRVEFLPRGLRPLAGNGTQKVTLTTKLESALVEVFLEAIEPMSSAGKLGALLLQLSPSFGPKRHSLAELDHLLDLLGGHRVAVELRNRGWTEGDRWEETVDYFRGRGVALVAVDGPPGSHFMIMPSVDVVTTPRLAYLRAHGRNTRGYVSGRSVAERFDYDYSDAELDEIAARARALAGLAGDTHIIFNNNKSNYAPKAAAHLKRIVAGQPAGAG
ncbi:MAG TPA: DUF72 domain-containing protein [Gemmataceae bacterium]|nr:DUF72 domain-containing protein [Gemmataceae bacterium]